MKAVHAWDKEMSRLEGHWKPRSILDNNPVSTISDNTRFVQFIASCPFIKWSGRYAIVLEIIMIVFANVFENVFVNVLSLFLLSSLRLSLRMSLSMSVGTTYFMFMSNCLCSHCLWFYKCPWDTSLFRCIVFCEAFTGPGTLIAFMWTKRRTIR